MRPNSHPSFYPNPTHGVPTSEQNLRTERCPSGNIGKRRQQPGIGGLMMFWAHQGTNPDPMIKRSGRRFLFDAHCCTNLTISAPPFEVCRIFAEANSLPKTWCGGYWHLRHFKKWLILLVARERYSQYPTHSEPLFSTTYRAA
jgi:hypothetical protein